MYDFVIIGGGTAGLSSAVYACRANKKTLVIEREAFGGQIVNSPSVENYPGIAKISGAQFASDLFDQVQALGASFAYESVTGIKRDGKSLTVATDEGEYGAKAVIIAAGCNHRKLGVAREDELLGSGISYCALCDGAFFADKNVAVVGGGNAAFTDALYLAGVAKQVYIVHRRAEFRAERTLVERAESVSNISYITGATVKTLVGGDELESIVLDVGGKEQGLEVSGLFVAVGMIPDNAKFGVKTDAAGYIVTDGECRTDIQGVYAAGDCRQKTVRQLTTAAADGAIAVSAALGDGV